MTTIDLLTVCAHPEMRPIAEWMFERQDCRATLRHRFFMCEPVGGNLSRHTKLAGLLEESDADYFMLCDDDDYHSKEYVQRCLSRIGDQALYGEIPKRIYMLRKPAWGEGVKRKRLFPTFVLYRSYCKVPMLHALRNDRPNEFVDWACDEMGFKPEHSEELIIMRGLMDNPRNAVTQAKNDPSHKNWGDIDHGYAKLREWVDAEAFEFYTRLAASKGWAPAWA